jgi:hypothetical protein
MTKVTIGISLDLDDIEIIDAIVRKYAQRSRAAGIHIIIRRWQQLEDERQKTVQAIRIAEKNNKKLSNPMVNL